VRHPLSRTTGELSPGDASTGISGLQTLIAAKPGGAALLVQSSADGSAFENADGDALANAGAYGFDGVDDKIQIADHADLRFVSGDFSYGCWFRAPATDQGAALITKRKATSPVNQYSLFIASTWGGVAGQQVSAFCYENSSTYRAALTVETWADGQWHHVMAVADRSANRMRIYVDGREANVSLYSAGAFPTISNSAPLAFGQAYDGAFKYQGDLDDVRIYDTKLTATDVWNLFARRHDGQAANLLGHWPLDANANDVSGNGHHGTLSGGPTSIATWSELPPCGEPLGNVTTLDWDGVDDYATPGSPTGLDDLFAGGGTIATWLDPSGLASGGTSCVLDKSSGTSTGWSLSLTALSGNALAVRFATARSGGWIYWQSAAVVPLSRWSHLAVSYDSDSAANEPTLYLDGNEVTWTTTPTPVGNYVSDAGANFIVGNIAGETQAFHGCLAGVAVWSNERTSSEISTSFTRGFEDTSEAALLGYWPLAGNGADLGPNGWTASIVGPASVNELRRPAAAPPSAETLDVSALGYTDEAHWRLITASQTTDRSAALDRIGFTFTSAGLFRHPGMSAGMPQLSGGFIG
ncbi:MAG: LamG domain-containing protein, partial [Planctomycetales bacterium]|nr:LamG domain-containing protein [Planctomycetales bacterium]